MEQKSYITEVDALDEAKECFLTYSAEVLTDRAIPAAEDGLLSSQRKILWTMSDFLGMDSKGKTKKCNALIGSTLATSYFHGDQACYGVLCKMSQKYLMRYPLIHGQGSLGTQEDNDLVASSRYCMTGDTLIPTSQGTIQLQDIVPNSSLSEEYDINLDVLGFDGQIHHASKLFNSGKWPVLKITLANGMFVTVTENHPLMVLDDNLNLTWKLAEQLTTEDKILLLVPNNNLVTGQRKDYLEAAMLGAMISEGYATTQNRIGINNKDLEMIEPVVEYILRELPTCEASICENKKRGYYEFCFADKYFYPQFIKEFEFEKSLTKHLPLQYFKGDLFYKATLLSYLFEGDGSIDPEHGITYSSISDTLIHQLQVSLLQDFGIVSNIVRAKKRNEIKLRINNTYAETFKNKINFISERKQKALNDLVIKINNQSTIANGNFCNIYKITQYIRNHYKGKYFRSHGFSNKKSYKQAKGYISPQDYEKISNLIENYVEIKITSIEPQSNKEIVYSLKIDDESHAYIGNGFINHNTEAKPSIYADLMMLDYKKKPVPTKETYNGEYMEPVVLPSLFPNAICNGRQAIGISMSHNSLPNNLKETCDAIIAYINNPNLTIDNIMKYMKGPDFPLGNVIINQKDIRQAYATGKSQTSLKVRGDYEIDGDKIIFTTIPYRTYRNKIKEQLEKNIDSFEKVLEDFNDESNIGNNKLVFFAKPGQTKALLNKLFALTDLQTSISFNMNYIVNGTPKLCSIKDLIKAYVIHQNNVMINIAKTDLAKAETRKHTLEGLLIAIKDIDTAIQLIKNSLDKEEARNKLIEHFNITEAQANAILDMKLAKLTKLDKDDLLKELEELRQAILKYQKTIDDQSYRNSELIEKVTWLRDKYGDDRRTKIIQVEDAPKEEKEIVNVEPEKCVVITTASGNIKRIPTSSFRTQKRNGKGVKTQDDITDTIIRTNTIDSLLIFSNKGNVYRLLVNDIPEGTNTSKGQPVTSLIEMLPGEKPTVIYSVYRDTNAEYIFFITKKGMAKKTSLKEYTSIKKKNGTVAIKLKEDDEIAAVALIKDESIILTTSGGNCIHFNSKEVVASGRVTMGVKAVTLKEDEEVGCMAVVREPTDNLAVFAPNGVARQIPLKDFPIQKRAGKGIKIGEVIDMTLIAPGDTLLVSGQKKNICIAASDIPILGRMAQGNQIIKGDRVISVSKI